jgi:hypothetical protein
MSSNQGTDIGRSLMPIGHDQVGADSRSDENLLDAGYCLDVFQKAT